jgi:hypothetical protein
VGERDGAENMTPWFKDLFVAIADWEGRGPPVYWSVLVPWLEANSDHISWLRDFAARGKEEIPPATEEELWALYSLSRVNDLLIHNFPPTDPPSLTPRPEKWDISVSEYESFATALGLTIVRPKSYSPVFHEIVVTVENSESSHPIELVDEFWPTTLLGNMLFSRGGVAIEGGTYLIDKEQAENSPMLWTYRRARRVSHDLSHGWGSNSQWRTSFRRDYIFGQKAHLNVDGKNGRGEDADLPPHPELLLNRCAIKHDLGNYVGEAWPYDTRLVVDIEPIDLP